MNQRIRVAVVGTGFGTLVHIPAFQSCPEAEVVAVCSAQESRAREAAARFTIPFWTGDYRSLLQRDDVDAISVSSPPFTHREMALAAAAAGKHILLEKPMGLSTTECGEMLAAAETAGVVHMIAHEFRWHPGRRYMADLIRDGYIGKLRHANVSVLVPARGGSLASPYHNWAARREMGGGMLMAIGSHFIDALRWWFGEFSHVVGATFAQVPERIDEATGATVLASADDGFTLQLGFRSGAWATMTQSMAAPFGAGARIELHGTEGSLVTHNPGFNPTPTTPVYGGRTGDAVLAELPLPTRYVPFEDDRDIRMVPFRLMVTDFIAAIRSGRPAPVTFHDGLKVQQVMDGAVRSMEARTWVDLP